MFGTENRLRKEADKIQEVIAKEHELVSLEEDEQLLPHIH